MNSLDQTANEHAEQAIERRLGELVSSGATSPMRPRGRRVLHCIGSLGPGGAERQLCNVAVGSSRLGWDVRVLTTSDLTGASAHYLPLLDEADVPAARAASMLHPMLRASLLNTIHRHLKIGDLPAFLQPYVFDFSVEMLADPPDIVHAWLDLTNIWAGVAAVLTGVPTIILSLRNMSPLRFPYLYQDWFKSWYALLAANPRVHFVNNSVAGARDYAEWIGLPLERIQVITNGVDFEAMRPAAPEAVAALRKDLLPQGGLLLLGVFRLSDEKQPMLFFEVARRALAEFDDLTVAVIGSGPLGEQLAAAIAEHGLSSRFHLLPYRHDIHTVLSAADLLLMTSRYEGTPNIVLEAQRFGLPVIGTRAGGTVEAIDDRRTGRLFNVDDVDGLSGAVRELLSDAKLRARYGAAGPAFVAARFGLERMVGATIACYERAMASAGVAEHGEPAQSAHAVPLVSASVHRDRGVKAKLRDGARHLYLRMQHHPAAARVANRVRQSTWLHGDLAVPARFIEAIRQQRAASPLEMAGDSLRVTHYIGGLGAGGSERQLCNLSIASARRGLSVRVLTAIEPTGANGHYAELLRAAGVSAARAGVNCHPLFAQAIENLPSLQLLRHCPGFMRPYMLDVLGEIMANPPHVLHCWLDLTNIWAGVAGLLADVPAIVLSTRSVNPSNFPGIDNPWFRPWYRALAQSPRVHFINNSVVGARDYAEWLKLPSSRFQVIRNGVDLSTVERPSEEERRELRRELGIPADAPVMIGVLRMTEEKQPMLFFQAGLEVVKRIPDAYVLMVGSGPLGPQVADAVEEHGVGKRFRMLGQRRDVYRLMAASDLLLLTSRLEGSPNVLLEAQWMGCAVATTPAGGAVDALAHGLTGLIVDGNPEFMCREVAALLTDRPRLRAMGQAGPAFVAENFAVERMVDETLDLYGRVLNVEPDGLVIRSTRQS